MSALREKAAAVSHCKSSSTLGLRGSDISPRLTSFHVRYAGSSLAALRVFWNSPHACVISGQSKKASCSISLSWWMQSVHSLGSLRRSFQAPTGKPSVRIIHCMADTFLGRYGCQILLKNFARALLLKPSASSSTSNGIWWLSCHRATL